MFKTPTSSLLPLEQTSWVIFAGFDKFERSTDCLFRKLPYQTLKMIEFSAVVVIGGSYCLHMTTKDNDTSGVRRLPGGVLLNILHKLYPELQSSLWLLLSSNGERCII